MKQRIEEAVVAAFIADALSLGVHWVYETSDIEQKYGRLEKMIKPELVSYHQFKEKGDFTHYGDQMLVLLESVRETAGFDLNHFSQSWQDMFISYTGYMDHATKVTCENFKSGKSPEESGIPINGSGGRCQGPAFIGSACRRSGQVDCSSPAANGNDA